MGGLNSNVNGRQGNEVYFIGIIDILTLFDLKKKAEHVLKTVKNFDNVSWNDFFFNEQIVTQSAEKYLCHPSSAIQRAIFKLLQHSICIIAKITK